MTPQEQIETAKAWAEHYNIHNDPLLANTALMAIGDFKAALKARLEEIKPKNPWSEFSDGKLAAFNEMISELIDEIIPLKK